MAVNLHCIVTVLTDLFFVSSVVDIGRGRGAFCMRKIWSFFVESGCLPLQRLVYVAMGGKWNHIEFHLLLFFLIPCFIVQGSLAIITDGKWLNSFLLWYIYIWCFSLFNFDCCIVEMDFGDTGLVLLEFRARIDSDPYGALANWNSNDTTPCTWYGVHCVGGKVQML